MSNPQTTPTAKQLAEALDMLLDVVTDKDTMFGNNFYNLTAIRNAQQYVVMSKEAGFLDESEDIDKFLEETINAI